MELQDWVEECARLAQPDCIHWCDGSEIEHDRLIRIMVKDGTLIPLHQQSYPRCYLHRSHPSDVARTENLTFICTRRQEDAGSTNNWMAPQEAHARIDPIFEGAMRGRTMYVVPYCMGPMSSPNARCGVELTDSPYVVANMRILTRMGEPALRRIEKEGKFVRGLHSLADLNPERRLILHFPEELLIKSVGSGYGGNALLCKKCHALRIASWQARAEGWLAEHMLIVGIEDPRGKVTYIAAAFPSACGKTNLAMLIPPQSLGSYKIWTIGDDICWMHLGDDGRLWAINPEAGFFGVAPGTSMKTNPNALAALRHDTIFTNVAATPDGGVWWEGLTERPPEGLVDWQGRPYVPGSGSAAHPNARFTVSMKQCPSYSPKVDDPPGVPISAIVFGGRRAELAPLVYQARDWTHGVLIGAAMSSETTAAATGKVGQVRRDPMAMLPFCGYNMADYWAHWLSFARKSRQLPKIFHVNWFRRDKDGNFLWPGFGHNLRVLRWIIERCEGGGHAVSTPIGYLPSPGSIAVDDLDITHHTMKELTAIDPPRWRHEMEDLGEFFKTFGDRVPAPLWQEQQRILEELK